VFLSIVSLFCYEKMVCIVFYFKYNIFLFVNKIVATENSKICANVRGLGP